MNFLVMSKGVWVEKGSVTGGAYQPYPQMGTAHMCGYNSLGGWWPLTASLNLAFIDSFWCPPHSGKGVWYGWRWLPPKLGRQLRRGPLVPVQSPKLQDFGLLREQLGYGGSGGLTTSFGWGGAEDTEECDTASIRSLHKPSASDLATASCTLCSPSASNCCASSHSILIHLSKSSPWKREKRVFHKGYTWP